MQPKYVVYVSDTIHGSSDRRSYKTLARAKARFEELRRNLRRNGHNGVVLAHDDGHIICTA